MIRNKLYTN